LETNKTVNLIPGLIENRQSRGHPNQRPATPVAALTTR